MPLNTRREFLEFMGLTAAGAALSPAFEWTAFAEEKTRLPFPALKSAKADELQLAKGFKYDILLKWRDPLNKSGAKFGYNNDFLAYLPLDSKKPLEGLLWVNHEYHDPFFNSGWRPEGPRTKEQVDIERLEVGGSIVHIKKTGSKWTYVKNSPYNRRFDALTEIPFVNPVLGESKAIGTLAGCAGGITPWGTVLSCEENYADFYGEVHIENGKRSFSVEDEYLSWQKFYQMPPEHYGWVVEIDLKTGKAKKLNAMGRFAHEGATVRQAKDGRPVVYMGDDAENQHLYKFIADRPGSLEAGKLFAADIPNGRWLPLDREQNKKLKKEFNDHGEMMVFARRAAAIAGATEMDRPEDIEIDSKTGEVYVSLTMNKSKHNLFGSILKISESANDPLALEFKSATFLTGGERSGVACPDNLAFDRNGNLWVCSDMSAHSMGKPEFEKYGHNSLFFVPLSGPSAGLAHRVANAPSGAEFTGPCFAPDGETLFLSVQHPGEPSRDPANLLSHWPGGGKSVPHPCVVALSGPAMKKILA